ncbi:hypothetical protein Flexsi_0515 [Flexistipes sinusarabici DSM 4947]|uniref:Uncharacterized protein n=1 Tax=Flexistipes sinusarabici (strain ATCC 49648 / DSM 4947 / MAS 10) TaxID=717231 RepID=F8E9F0_FLESM|nr:hypothetical protein [Flexistipes sinusarabici]AEI14202.1 hypothetical protein Flexsi_0515 [Flexistipes sinusarabici DSM 4947]
MKRFILGLFIIPFVDACGGSVSDGNSGSSFESARVYVSGSSIEGGAYDADSVDKGSGSCDNVSNYTFTPDDITVNVKSEALPNLPSDLELAEVEVYKITVSFTPNDDISPELSTKEYYPVSYIIEPNSTKNIPVRIIDRIEKVDNESPLYFFDNLGKEYNYTVNIEFKAEELLYGGTDSLSYSFQLRYFDEVDDCT